MTFQEILAEVQKLSDEEKRLLVKTVSDDLSGIAVDDGDEVWSPEVESLQPFLALLDEANKITAAEKVQDNA